MSNLGKCCIRSAHPVTTAAAPGSRLVTSRALTIFLAVALLTSSLLIVASWPCADQLDIVSTSDQTTAISNLVSPGKAHLRTWDWKAMADQSGYVDAILWEDDFRSIQKVVDRLEGRYPEKAALGVDVAFLHQHSQIKNKFTQGFQGLSVKITADALAQLLSSEPTLRAYPDLEVKALDIQTDQQIGADLMWNRTDAKGKSIVGTGITVAVIDSGICYTHPDLGGGFGPSYKVRGGFDFCNNDSDPMDDYGHGTHVAGIIAADGGIKGVAPGASLLAYKALGADGLGWMSKIILSIEAAMDPNGDGSTSDHANVISMSIGGQGEPDDPICLAIKSAVAAGVVVVVAAGNSGPLMGTIMSPGMSPDAITVGAVDGTGLLASSSSRGPTTDLQMKPEISAPGVGVLSTVPYGSAVFSSTTGYMRMSGTSMATPHVSGAVALLLQAHPDWSPLQVESALVSGAKQLDNSFWNVGAGEVWIPSSADVSLFSSEPLTSLGILNGTAHKMSIYNSMQDATFSVGSSDWNSLSANSTVTLHDWRNFSTISPASIRIASKGSGEFSISISAPSTCAQGYYDGFITLTSGSAVCRMPFGFLVLSRVNVHVIDITGFGVYDPYGGALIYSYPGAETVMRTRAIQSPSSTYTYFLPSGQYAVHAGGRQYIYSSNGPYLLSAVFALGRLEMRDVNLTMSSAHVATINLETNEGYPIYAKDFRFYARYAGVNNALFDFTASDLSVSGSGVLSLPHNVKVYVSDTEATIGFSISGYAYSRSMWNFMSLNWNHWYEFIGSSSTSFKIPATADLQYLLGWEFPRVNSSFPSILSYDMNSSSVYVTKYDIPGTIVNPWGLSGTHRAIGGESASWIRMDTSVPVNSFFSGMTRTTFVNGVFSEPYYPRGLSSGYLEREFYVPDYSHVIASFPTGTYLPDRYFVTAVPHTDVVQRLGAGPFYPSLHTANTNSSMILFHPLLRDQWGSKVVGMSRPVMNLYKSGSMVGSYQLSEYVSIPDAERVFSLAGSGRYSAQIGYTPFSELFNNVSIELSFSVPSLDPDPPMITGLSFPQRFVPGDRLALSVSANDARSGITLGISSRAGDGAPWVALNVNMATPGCYTAMVSTSTTDSVVDLKITVRDSSGNYLNYTAYKVAQKVTPVLFDIKPSVTEFEFNSTSTTVVLTGYLTDSSGGPLHPSAGVPLELWANGKKIGMVLDEYVSGTSHQHNGTIRFDWILRPTDIFSAANQTVNVTVSFDLGTYSSQVRTFSLQSIASKNTPPVIRLLSPTSGSLIAAGTSIDLSVTDDGVIASSGYSVGGSAYVALSSPWSIGTSEWSEGTRNVSVFALDDCGANASAKYSFELDAFAPTLTISSPLNGSVVATGSKLVVNVYDSHLAQVNFSLDGGQSVALPSPYTWDMTSWSLGNHVVVVRASDSVGHVSVATTTFTILDNGVIVSVKSPANGSVTRSGVSIMVDIVSLGTVTCSWSEYDVTHALTPPYQISTSGWSEGDHQITISAANSLGGQAQLVYSLRIDDTAPVIQLLSPSMGSFVCPSDQLLLEVSDSNIESIAWTLWGVTHTTSSVSMAIPLASSPADGRFTLYVIAVDKAGNQARSEFSFEMDSSPPVIEVANVASGDCVQKGYVLDVVVYDQYLMEVQWSLDGGQRMMLASPFDINTNSFSVGWHSLQIVACDASGKVTTLTLSLYLDTQSPLVEMLSSNSFTPEVDFGIRASVTDDYGVGSVLLYYELTDGSYASSPMLLDGEAYVAILPAGSLWDGMNVYVACQDVAGNSVLGPYAQLIEIEPSSGPRSPAGFLSTIGGIFFLCTVALISTISLLFVSKRRNKDEDTRFNSLPSGKLSDDILRSQPISTGPPSPRVRTSSAMGAQLPSSRMDTRSGQFVGNHVEAKSCENGTPRSHPTLIDSIPEVVFKNQPEEQEADFGDLIERELIIPSIRNSVFRENVKDLNSEVATQLEELRTMIRDKPKGMSG